MNQENLAEYKKKAYNPGTPLKQSKLPFLTSSTKPKVCCAASAALQAKNPFFLQKSGTKRKVSSRTYLSPEQKASRMGDTENPPTASPLDTPHMTPPVPDPDLAQSIAKIIEASLLPKMQNMITNAVTKEFERDRETIKSLQITVNELEVCQTSLSDRVSQLENSGEGVNIDLDSITESILPEVNKSVSKVFEAQWVETLKQEIREAQSDLFIRGLEPGKIANKTDAKTFFSEKMKLSCDDINIVSVRPLKNPKNKKESVIVKFSHVSEQNLCFKSSHNLPIGMSVDQSVPKKYQQRYNVFKETAWKLRTTQGVMTRIGFEGHKLTLKIKKKDTDTLKYDWTIFEEYSPKFVVSPPSPPKPAPSRGPVGTIPTPPLNAQALEGFLIFSKIESDLKDIDLETEFHKIFTEECKKKIVEIRAVNQHTFSVKCKDRNAASNIQKDYNDFKFEKGSLQVTNMT